MFSVARANRELPHISETMRVAAGPSPEIGDSSSRDVRGAQHGVLDVGAVHARSRGLRRRTVRARSRFRAARPVEVAVIRNEPTGLRVTDVDLARKRVR